VEELAHMVTFARVVKAGSFAGAARLLKITDSAASKHVAKLERALGVRLLNRSTRKLSLTEAGATYYAHCARIVEEVENSKRALAELQAVPRGLLRVTAPVPFASRWLGPVLHDFLKRYPQIQLDLDASNRVVDLAAEGFDVALRAARALPPNVVARPLLTMRLHLFASPQYLKRAGTPRHPAELARHNCLSLSPALQGEVWPFVRGEERVEIPVRGSMQSNMVEALHDLVVAGTGVTLLPAEMVGKDLRGGRLTPLLADWRVDTYANLYAVYLPTRYLAPKVRVFIDFLAERFAGGLPSVAPAGSLGGRAGRGIKPKELLPNQRHTRDTSRPGKGK
jgi:DNA-binding transcriptional LysR family regulator